MRLINVAGIFRFIVVMEMEEWRSGGSPLYHSLRDGGMQEEQEGREQEGRVERILEYWIFERERKRERTAK